MLCMPSCREELVEDAVIAVARDASKPLDELGPSDWELMEVRCGLVVYFFGRALHHGHAMSVHLGAGQVWEPGY